jgi:hypothetical protein
MRQYNYTFAELLDRIGIVQMKAIFIQEYKDSYDEEIKAIKHDLDLLIKEKNITITSTLLHAIEVLMLSNRYIWENETKVRSLGNNFQQENLLRLTHSINGVRNNAKNIISKEIGERVDLKIDCLASDLIKEFGNWNINYEIQ